MQQVPVVPDSCTTYEYVPITVSKGDDSVIMHYRIITDGFVIMVDYLGKGDNYLVTPIRVGTVDSPRAGAIMAKLHANRHTTPTG